MTDRVIQIGNIVGHIKAFDNPQRGRLYDISGISPTVCNFAGGG